MALERRHARQKLQSLEYVEIGREGDGNGGFLLDLSEDGAAVQMAHPAPLDDEFQLRFSLGAAGAVRARGRIVWRDAAGKALGISFTDLDDFARARITQWLAENQDVPGYEWSVTPATVPVTRSSPAPAVPASPASPAIPELHDPLSSPPSPAQQPHDSPLEPAPDAAPVPGEARFINIPAPPRQIHHAPTQPVPGAIKPTATFLAVSPADSIHRSARRDSPAPALPAPELLPPLTAANSPAGNPFADPGANPFPAPKSDPLARKNRPASTPYFSLESPSHPAFSGATNAADNTAANRIADREGNLAGASASDAAPPASSVRSWLSEWGDLTGSISGGPNPQQPTARHPLLRGIIIGGVPALIIVWVLAYSMTHSGNTRAIAPAPLPPSSQPSSSLAANANPAAANSPPGQRQPSASAPNAQENTQPGDPAPLGPGSLTSGAIPSGSPGGSSGASSPDANPSRASPSSLSPASPGPPSSQSASDGTSSGGAPAATGPSAKSQPGDREYFMGMQSLRGQGDTPGSAAAASYFWQAVTDGNLRAELALAELYLRGDGVTKDCDQARVLLHTAASHGSDDAPRVLASLSSYGCEPPVKKKPR